jgi:hypothetical protein
VGDALRLIIAGGRDLKITARQIHLLVDALVKHISGKREYPLIHLITGGCPTGVDAAAAELSDQFFKHTEMKADWDTHGKPAGPIRNSAMAKFAAEGEERGVLLLIWDGKSSGSADMLKKAQSKNLHVVQVIYT